MSGDVEARENLYARSDALTHGRTQGDVRGADEAVQDRLAENLRAAEAYGWTSCAVERAGGSGRLTAWGTPPGDVERRPIPDWLPASR